MRGGNLNRRIVGKCSLCGGVVSVPTVFWSVNRPVPTCESCGAKADVTHNLPIVPMKPLGVSKRKDYEFFKFFFRDGETNLISEVRHFAKAEKG